MRDKNLDERSWFRGKCKDCGFNIVVTQPDPNICADYWWYCSNKKCKNHIKGEHTGDMQKPSFLRRS